MDGDNWEGERATKSGLYPEGLPHLDFLRIRRGPGKTALGSGCSGATRGRSGKCECPSSPIGCGCCRTGSWWRAKS